MLRYILFSVINDPRTTIYVGRGETTNPPPIFQLESYTGLVIYIKMSFRELRPAPQIFINLGEHDFAIRRTPLEEYDKVVFTFGGKVNPVAEPTALEIGGFHFAPTVSSSLFTEKTLAYEHQPVRPD